MNKKLKVLSCVACVLAFCFLAIGYAAIQDDLYVSGSVSILVEEKPDLKCTDTEAYTFDAETGVVTILDVYYDTNDHKFYRVTGIDKEGFSQSAIQALSSDTLDATGILYFELSAHIATIGENAFTGLSNLKSFTVDEYNEHFTAVDGVLYNYDRTTLVRYPSNKSATYYIVPDTVTTICTNAFSASATCTAIVTTLYDNTAWGSNAAVMLNAFGCAYEIANIDGSVEEGYTVTLKEANSATDLVLQGNNYPNVSEYGDATLVSVSAEGNVGITSTSCNANEDGHFAQLYISSTQPYVYGYLDADNTLKIRACDATLVGGGIYQKTDDEKEELIDNERLYNLPSGEVENHKHLPTDFEDWTTIRTKITKVEVVDSIAPNTLLCGKDGDGRDLSWFNSMTKCTEMDLAKLDTSNVESMRYLFYNCTNLTELDLKTFDTSQVTNMYCMFFQCHKLVSLDVSKFETINVTNMALMFSECYVLEILDVSHFNTQSVTNMQSMFWHCEKLQSLDLSDFKTSQVTNMSHMFQYAKQLITLDLSSFETTNVEKMEYMFDQCIALTKLTLSDKFTTANVRYMEFMFNSCNSLTELDLSSFSICHRFSMERMFNECRVLKKIIVSNQFFTKKPTNSSRMFDGCKALVGGNGTEYDENNKTYSYAIIDGAGGAHGYFTAAEGTTVDYADVTVKVTELDGYTCSFTNENQHDFFLNEANSVKLLAADDTLFSGTITLTYGDETKDITVDEYGSFEIPADFVKEGAVIEIRQATNPEPDTSESEETTSSAESETTASETTTASVESTTEEPASISEETTTSETTIIPIEASADSVVSPSESSENAENSSESSEPQ